jgi:hypothetical protein
MNCQHGVLAKIGLFWFCNQCNQQFTITPLIAEKMTVDDWMNKLAESRTTAKKEGDRD